MNPNRTGPARGPISATLTTATLIAALAGLAPATAARAQVAGSQQIPIPLLDTGDAVSLQTEIELLGQRLAHASQRGGTAAAVPADTRPALISPLRPVEARGRPAGSALRFDGERRGLDFELYLPEGAQMQTLRIATLSSINVLPERSAFRVYLNGLLIGTGRLEHVTETGVLDLIVPEGVARAGTNAVHVELLQYHRIYCGPEAAFALWSDIDLARSGAVLADDGQAAGAERFLMAMAAASATGAGIELRGTELLGPQRDAWVGALTQRIAASLGGDPIPFRFTRFWSLAAPAPVPARITFVPATQAELRYARGGDGAQVIVIGVPPGAGPLPLPDFDLAFPLHATRAAPPLIDTARPVALAELGFADLEARDRYSLNELRFRLPDDYVILTNAKSEMTLTYAYAPDLPEGAALQILINGINIRMLPLRGEGGRLIEDFPIRFEARHLRAGVNTLGFEVIVPGDPADLPCPQRDLPVVEVSAGSTISVAYSPSMYLADMYFAFSALTPASVETGDMTARSYTDLDVLTLRAALVAGAAPRPGQPGARLTLIPPEDLGAVPTANYQISRRAVEHVLSPVVEAPAPVADAPAGMAFLRPDRPRDGGLPTALTAGWNWVQASASAALQWMHPRAGAYLDSWLMTQSGQAVLLQLDPERPDQIWMLRAPGADINAITAALVAARASGEGPRGQVAVLDHDGRWQSWYAPDRQPVLLEPLSASNLRHVVGNFVSAMPIRYVAGLFLLAIISAFFALRLVTSTREH